ncbi:hypothetical protein CW306_26720 [Bacillus sp. BA3]|nr:hypothetical protein CW306_26720 [Bacillus sp. BA3]
MLQSFFMQKNIQCVTSLNGDVSLWLLSALKRGKNFLHGPESKKIITAAEFWKAVFRVDQVDK